ncbi:Ankyrin 2,3/unc44 [Mycena sanguinolenta]|uniref:Ankyrin 2,3/unc44 n=1 Tax=Mycena sanguinolenta TaxID=230812 RepID=A0A8H7CBF5_9AGAR|nr:Ankyrin 2,3/unc44 [Mycena sanguinolenta]
MSHHTFHVHGGRGGQGGPGNEHGGLGGVGEGPTVDIDNINNATFNMPNGGEIMFRQRDAILDWLSPINFFLRHAAISEVRDKGTGGWLLADPLYNEWESGSGETLWCCGIPGAGKTVLVSMVVDHLHTKFTAKDIGVACIYLNHKEVDSQTPSRLLAGLWRQLVDEIGPVAENLYKQHRKKGTAPSLEEVASVLRSRISELSKVFIIIDAIDEYPEFQRHILLKQLEKMHDIVNFMITSRPNISLEDYSFQNLKTLDISAMPEDIEAYIDAQINLSPHLSRHVKQKSDLREEIHTKITSTVDGMFLLAKLHLQSLCTKKTIKAVRDALKELPKDLHNSYDVAMQRIEAQSEDDRKTAWSTLTWVANAKRLLTVEELQVALAIEPGTQSLDEENFMTIQTILSVCAGLVIVEEEHHLEEWQSMQSEECHQVVRLVHYTAQEYLDNIQAEKFPNAQTKITHTLLTFLTFDGYPVPTWHLSKLPPLAEYSQYCLAHAAGQPEVALREILLKFVGQAFQWMEIMNPQGSWGKWDSPPWNYHLQPSQPSALWIAAAANLVETTKLLLNEASLLQDLQGGFIAASYYGHIRIVNILLEKSTDVNAAERGQRALQAAATQGHTEIVSILLEHSADVNAAGGEYRSPLHAAAAQGHTKIVGILLEHGANVNVARGKYGSPLQAAAARGHTEIVGILLEHGANVNAAGGKHGSPLQAAGARGHTEIVGILLEHGADVNAAGGEYGSLLPVAAAQGHTKIVGILLEHGADVNAAGDEYGSPLPAAAARGHTEIVTILLEHGANVNAAGGKYGSALQAAAAKGHSKIVGILLEHSADVNAAGGEYGSPLHAAASEGHTKIVGILLEHGADVNVAGGCYASPLWAAAIEGHTEIVGILLEHGADVNAAEGEYGSPLQAAAAEGHTEIVGILLEHGADVNAAGGYYGSSLQAAAARGHTEIVGILLEHSADVNAAGSKYRSPLQAAAAGGHTKIVGILLEHSADANAAVGEHGSALQIATDEGYKEIVSMLLERGASFSVAMENSQHT